MRSLVLASASLVACTAPLEALVPPSTTAPPDRPATLDGGPSDAAPRVTLSARWDHTCRVDAEGTLACWGANGRGQLGDGTTVDHVEPVTLPGRWRVVSAGIMGTCAIDADGALWCWGAVGLARDPWRPSLMGADHDWVEVATGPALACGLRAGGALWCWGRASAALGGLDAGGDAPGFAPVRVPGVYRAVDLHWYRLVALTDDGSLATLDFGADGTAAAIVAHPPVIDAAAAWQALRVGVLIDYAVATDGTVWRRAHDAWSPLGVRAALPLAASAAYALCVVEAEGSLACHAGDDREQPLERVPGSFVAVAHSLAERCAVDADANTWCWATPHRGRPEATPRRVR